MFSLVQATMTPFNQQITSSVFIAASGVRDFSCKPLLFLHFFLRNFLDICCNIHIFKHKLIRHRFRGQHTFQCYAFFLDITNFIFNLYVINKWLFYNFFNFFNHQDIFTHFLCFLILIIHRFLKVVLDFLQSFLYCTGMLLPIAVLLLPVAASLSSSIVSFINVSFCGLQVGFLHSMAL